jgi:cytochrome c oxidase subunit II
MPVFLRTIAVAAAIVACAACLLMPEGAAYAGLGQATPWQIGLQDAASPVMEEVNWFHNVVLVIITAITLFVLALLVIVMVKFNARANPVPSRTTHNTLVEVLWTVIPVLILVIIALPSFRILFFQLNTPAPDLVVKATGVTWNWTYSYPDYGDWEFSSIHLEDKELKPGQPRLLSVDNELVVPVNKNVKVLVTSDGSGVIHAFAVPSFGIKIDAIPGRLNETWFKATKEGWYYGQCSELCGRDHAYMPIAVRVVSDDEFKVWIEQAKKKYAAAPKPTDFAATDVAATDVVAQPSGGYRLQ